MGGLQVNSLCFATFSFSLLPLSLSLSLAVFTHWQRDGNQNSSACGNVKNRLFTDACTHKHTVTHQQQKSLGTHCHTHRNYTHHTVTKDLRPACESLCACPLCSQSDSDGVSTGCDLLSAGWPTSRRLSDICEVTAEITDVRAEEVKSVCCPQETVLERKKHRLCV